MIKNWKQQYEDYDFTNNGLVEFVSDIIDSSDIRDAFSDDEVINYLFCYIRYLLFIDCCLGMLLKKIRNTFAPHNFDLYELSMLNNFHVYTLVINGSYYLKFKAKDLDEYINYNDSSKNLLDNEFELIDLRGEHNEFYFKKEDVKIRDLNLSFIKNILENISIY